MDNATCFDLFAWKYGRGRKLRLSMTSEDPELCKYFNYLGSLGSTYMDTEGNIIITIHDKGGATPATWYEELMHAKQFIDRGQCSIGIGGTLDAWEVEVADCLLVNAVRLGLTEEEKNVATRSKVKYSRGGCDV